MSFTERQLDMTCLNCGACPRVISRALEVCLDCLRRDFPSVAAHVERVHRETRVAFHLPESPPKDDAGTLCNFCINECRIPDGQRGYCAVRVSQGGKIVGGKAHANVDWYYDPLPTNCVADWVCPGGTGAGYPKYAYRPGPEYGYQNLAVFYNACTFNCLFCQNWHYRLRALDQKQRSVSALADQVDDRTACICYFGGDPTPQLMHSLDASRLALERNAGRLLRICWETNGAMHPALLKQMAKLSLVSGGCIKFDLKAWSEGVHRALCGASNKRTLENFAWLAHLATERPEPPLVVASTLLVPGYVDAEEVRHLAEFIAELDPEIPYTLLAFHPQFYMEDLPMTSRSHAHECVEAARAAGLKRVRVGNLHLLGAAY